jgi:CheY-like chemotaxis protein
MVIEDNDATREAFGLILGSQGYRVTTAVNGREALALLRELNEHPSVILLDLMMPVMDGWQFREAQCQDARMATIPVIICSAAGEIHLRAACLDAAGYLNKPVEVLELLEAIRPYCC